MYYIIYILVYHFELISSRFSTKFPSRSTHIHFPFNISNEKWKHGKFSDEIVSKLSIQPSLELPRNGWTSKVGHIIQSPLYFFEMFVILTNLSIMWYWHDIIIFPVRQLQFFLITFSVHNYCISPYNISVREYSDVPDNIFSSWIFRRSR